MLAESVVVVSLFEQNEKAEWIEKITKGMISKILYLINYISIEWHTFLSVSHLVNLVIYL